MALAQQLIDLADIWSKATGLSHATLATKVVNDGKFFASLRFGASCTLTRFERVMDFFADPKNWPGGQVPAEAQPLLWQRGKESAA